MSDTQIQVDLDLVRKYNRPGPRYTSYPTALKFTEEFSQKHLIDDIRANNSKPRPLSLYFHLPFCETLCWFCGCTTVITLNHGKADRYLDYLERELQMTSPLIHPDSKVVQMHFGGGTPNFFGPEQIDRLDRMIKEHFNFEPDAEISVEIDPRRLSREHMEAFYRLGARRTSFGIQDFDPAVQKAVNRIQPKELSDKAAAWVREVGYESLNIDLIYGLPHQTPETFAHTIDLALELTPDRFAIFNYAHVPWMKPAQKIVERAVLPTPEVKLAMLKTVIESLTARGYVYIGMDHFARESDELAIAQKSGSLWRNFQGYSTRAGVDIYGFGMSSISQTETHYRQNEKALDAWEARIDSGDLPYSRACFLTDEDKLRRDVIMRLMCDLGLDYDALSIGHGINFRSVFAPEIQSLSDGPAQDGLIELTETGFKVTDIGRLLIRNLAMTFDAYLSKSEDRFSRTI